MCEDMGVRGAQGLVWVCDDLVVVRHHGSVSGSTSSLRAVSG